MTTESPPAEKVPAQKIQIAVPGLDHARAVHLSEWAATVLLSLCQVAQLPSSDGKMQVAIAQAELERAIKALPPLPAAAETPEDPPPEDPA